jgi:hypothetical protein
VLQHVLPKGLRGVQGLSQQEVACSEVMPKT